MSSDDRQPAERGGADAAFAELAGSAVDVFLEQNPDTATWLGDHRFDDRLPDRSPAGEEARRRAVGALSDRLARVDADALSPQHRVDALILANRLADTLHGLDERRDHTWNPLVANPGQAVYHLLARDFAPWPDRLRSLAGRLAAVPETLAAARAALAGAMPRVHIETALGQFAGTATLIGEELDRRLEREPADRAAVDAVRPAALAAIEEHRRWLTARLEDGNFRDPRIGAELFAHKLSLTLDTTTDADALLAHAEEDLRAATEEISEAASRRAGRPASPEVVREVLDGLAADAPDDATILAYAAEAMAAQTAFVRENALVSTFDDPVEVIEMPEIDRGVAVAYCDPPGPLETVDLPTFVAVAPTPSDWTPERVASFYREYNRHMVQNLMVHEAMPGHVLQMRHWRRFAAPTPVRSAFYSGSFVEGWAVYAELLMARHGYPGEGDAAAVRMQQLKMRLRMIINTILDIRVHTRGMTEDEAMRLMTGRGFQEEGEAAGKWRRAQLTSTQLCTYYVGYTEVHDLARALHAAHPEWDRRTLHDAMLAHGSPAPRHLHALLLPEAA